MTLKLSYGSLKVIENGTISAILGTVSYSHSIVTMALSCIVLEIKRRIGRKSRVYFIPPSIRRPVRGGGVPAGVFSSRLVWKN